MNIYLISKLQSIQQKIGYYNQQIIINPCPHIKNYYGCLINNEIVKLQALIGEIYEQEKSENRVRQVKKEFTLEELSKYDGANGSPAYISINGIVYDVSLSPVWAGGTHYGLYAGRDLTAEFKNCHEDQMSILENLPKVGKLKV